MRRQRPNVERMGLLGAEVRPVEFGTRTLKEATSEAIRDWITNVETTHYLIGSAVGPHPYPAIVRELQARDRPRGARAVPRRGGAAAGGRRRVRRRRVERDRDVRGLPRRRRTCGCVGVEASGAASLGSGRAGRAARRALVDPRRRGRADPRRALDLRRARLSGRRPRARGAAGQRARAVRGRDGRGGARRRSAR